MDIKTKNKNPEQEVDVLCCLRDTAKTTPDIFFVGGINENGKWYVYCSDGEITQKIIDTTLVIGVI